MCAGDTANTFSSEPVLKRASPWNISLRLIDMELLVSDPQATTGALPDLVLSQNPQISTFIQDSLVRAPSVLFFSFTSNPVGYNNLNPQSLCRP